MSRRSRRKSAADKFRADYGIAPPSSPGAAVDTSPEYDAIVPDEMSDYSLAGPPPRPDEVPSGGDGGAAGMVWKRSSREALMPSLNKDMPAGKAGGGFISKEGALVGAVMGGGNLAATIGGAAGGALGGVPGAIVGNLVGQLAGSIGSDVMEAASIGYSKADLSAYIPEGGASSQMAGNDRQITGMLQSMQSSMLRVANVGVRTTGGKPNRL